MAALNFPSNPTNGQVFVAPNDSVYTYSSVDDAWKVSGNSYVPMAGTSPGAMTGELILYGDPVETYGAVSKHYVDTEVGGKIEVGESAPGSPEEGDVWWDSSDDAGVAFIYYDSYWVPLVPQAMPDVEDLWDRSGTSLSPKYTGDDLTNIGSATFSGTGVFTGTVTGATPSASGHLTTKDYVDSAVAAEDFWNKAGNLLTPKTSGDAADIAIAYSGAAASSFGGAVTVSSGNLAVSSGSITVSGTVDGVDVSTIPSTYATSVSPTLSGIPIAPTAAAGTNSTQLATTSFVTSAITTAIAEEDFWDRSNSILSPKNANDVADIAITYSGSAASSFGGTLTVTGTATAGNFETTGTATVGNFVTTGYLRGPSSFVIDPAAHGDDTGTLVVAGNLQVDGTTSTVNSTTLTVKDKNIVVAKDSANKAAANGAGLTVDCGSDTDATILYDSTNDQWDFNNTVTAPAFSGPITGNASTATVLATARAINGVDFDGSAAITVTAAAGTLTGATLNSGVTASSLTSVGTLTALTSSGDLTVNTDALFVDASAKQVLINTTSPGYTGYADTLTIADEDGHSGITIRSGTDNLGSIWFSDATGAAATEQFMGFIDYHHTDDSLRLGTNKTVKLFIDSSGVVKIGGTLPSSPNITLTGSDGTITSAGRINSTLPSGSTTTNIAAAVTGTVDSSYLGMYSGGTRYAFAAYSDATNSISTTIGYDGSATFAGNIESGDIGSAGVQLYSIGSVFSRRASGGASDYLYAGYNGADLKFSVAADGSAEFANTVSIDSANNVLNVESNRTSGTTFALVTGRGNSGADLNLIIWNNGNIQNANNSYGAISDIKLKENIVDASSQWDDLKAIQVRNYNFIEGQTHTQIGVVAQEVELVSPGLVTESPDRDEDDNDLGTTTKSVNYSVLYMKAVKALQEAMERIEILEQRLSDAGIA